MTIARNVDQKEVSKFEELAHRWWDPNGSFKPLHDINPLRADYIDQRRPVAGQRVLDIGCGGGLLTEELDRRDAEVTGIDAATHVLNVARAHQADSGTEVNYLNETAEEHLRSHHEYYDVVTCLELLEHVPDPPVLVRACAELARPGASIFFSTINRNAKSWLGAIVGAEYVLRLLPRGTHEYHKFIKPSELAAWGRAAGLELRELNGMFYNPFTGRARLQTRVDINYLVWMQNQ